MDVLIAGGGIAGLEALLGLREVAGDRVRLTLIAPGADFSYRPMAVAEPFAVGRARHVALADIAAETGAELVADGLEAVDDQARQVRLSSRATRGFDALLVATGARAIAGVEGAVTWWPEGDSEAYGGLLRDIEEGYSKRVAVVVPPGAAWPLPAYELAIMTAGEARDLGQDDVQVTIVTPERTPLSLFGPEAGAAVAEELERAGVRLITGAVARRAEGGGLVLEPGGERLDVERVVAVPRLVGPAIAGLAADDEGFLLAGEDGRVEGTERTWAAGDGVDSPLKFGALATHQARVAIAGIARLAGVSDPPDPGEAVIEGRLLVGLGSRRLRGRGDADAAPLWWPQGKVAGEYLPRWLAGHGFGPPPRSEPPRDEGVHVRRSVDELAGAEANYLFDLRRRYRIDDPAIASLGRAIHQRSQS